MLLVFIVFSSESAAVAGAAGAMFFGGFIRTVLITHEPPHDKTNKMACAPNEDSDQAGHPPSLIRVFAVRMKKA